MPADITHYPKGPIFRAAAELGLTEEQREEMLHVATARVVLADYELLQHDFPQLRAECLLNVKPVLGRLSHADREEQIRSIIDDWLVVNAAVVSRPQFQQTDVNTRIATDGVVAHAYRPARYGRAVVLPVRHWPTALQTTLAADTVPGGLLDLKGVGVAPGRSPSHETSSNGLEALECALRDHLIQRALDEIFAREVPTLCTLPTYAVLDLGFDLTGRWRRSPAGAHVRRAHRRTPVDMANPDTRHVVRLAMERLLRRYGLTSAHAGHTLEISEQDGRVLQRIAGVVIEDQSPATVGLCLALKGDAESITIEQFDIQTAGELTTEPPCGQMVDFGMIHCRRSFDHAFCASRGVTLGGILQPNDPTFVHPDPELALPIEAWDPRRLTAECSRLARLFRRGDISRSDLKWRLEAALRAAREVWSRASNQVAAEINAS